METQNYDIIIIGAGAGGGMLASYLAPSGKKILVIDRGTWLPREKRNWDVNAVMVDPVYENAEPWINKNGDRYHSNAHYNVGGNSKFWGAALNPTLTLLANALRVGDHLLERM
jgi:choline dehydrogenase-like flavoprotein